MVSKDRNRGYLRAIVFAILHMMLGEGCIIVPYYML
jgi:hypothetical protein